MEYDRTRYFMDDPREARRLDAKVDPERFIDDFLLPVLSDGYQKIVDVGCGAGAILAALAKRAPGKELVGVDISGARIAEAQKKLESLGNVACHEASIYEIPIETGSVDVVYIRFLMEYLREPVKALAELKRIVKRGGTIVVQDLDGQLLFQYPHAVPEIETVFRVLHEKTGFDPYVGRKLYTYSRKVGLSLGRIDVRPYHLFAGKIDALNEELWNLKFEIATPQFADALGSLEEAERLREKFMNFLRDDDSFLYSVLFTLYLVKAED